jgi:hypothetical protein
MRGQTLLRVLKFMALGAVSFWLPDTLWHAFRGFKFDAGDTIGISVLMPLSLLGTYFAVVKKMIPGASPRRHVVWPMLLGVWLFGGFFMVMGASFSGGGFAGANGPRGAAKIILASLVPIVTFMMSTYDGSLLALLIVSLAALIVILIGGAK